MLLATAGKGGADLTPFAAEHFPFMNPSFAHPGRVALIQRVSWAYLRHALGIEDASWTAARKTLSESAAPLGRIEAKR